VHSGHLHIARQSQRIFGLSQVLFVVASEPPHKPPEQLIPFAHRYAMVSLATSGCAAFLPSLVELEPPASPYSIETMAKLAQRFGVAGRDLYFIAGGDSLLDVAGWHSSETLLHSYNFVFIMRPGVPAPDIHAALPTPAASRVVDCRGLKDDLLQRRVAADPEAPDCRIFLVDADAPDIAASQVRRMTAAGQRIDHLVPAAVHEYIVKFRLYGE
jgi:nicotinate-nucleotide adenylyltransferase